MNKVIQEVFTDKESWYFNVSVLTNHPSSGPGNMISSDVKSPKDVE